MGKKHFSDNDGRRGRATNRPSGDFKKSDDSRRSFDRDSRPSGNRYSPDGGNRGNEGGSRGNSAFPSRPSFGRPSGPGNRNAGTGGRDFGNRNADDRGATPRGGYSYDRRDDRRGPNTDRRDTGYGQRDAQSNRPARPYEPKANWSGQPYRQEGRPTVPRGTQGERNRKFQKQNPNEGFREERSENVRPRNTDSDFRPRTPNPTEDTGRELESGPNRPVRAARPFDFRSRPDDIQDSPSPRTERENRDNRSDRSSRGEEMGRERRDYSSDRNPRFSDRREGEYSKPRPGASTGGFGAKRESRPYGDRDRDSRTPSGPRSDRPTSNRADKPRRNEVAGEAPDYRNLKHYEEDKTRGNKRRREEDDAGDEIRLNRYIANAGICSRREADTLIAAGEIKVNGEVVTEMGYKVQPSDTVQYGKTNLNREKLVYVLLNKPKDFITTTDDPEGRKTVMDLVATASKERIFPVGRLDRNTTGLLLFTNDGEVAQKLSHPSHKNKKIYQVELDKPLTEDDLHKISKGVELEDGRAEIDDVAVVAGNPHFVGVELHTGRNRIVRRIFEHLGYDVVTLDRVQYAGLTRKNSPAANGAFCRRKKLFD